MKRTLEPSNRLRRQAARAALKAYANIMGESYVGDLLADLMHLCQLKSEDDFEHSLEVARRHFAEEQLPRDQRS